ncbi:hypothetical protein HPB52_012223 [Rhipicephalus sanguineus]|uniref:Uncharacterized protein n=1 Tax=Rhipicephalus sanguineus TaxID=34632 RepID=A0A9D4T9Q5_RHISA|nr:hypothetical protein HPB52_012223 [Rhipicephalus sanguineus]
MYHNVRLLLEFLDQQEFEKYLQSFLDTEEEKLRDFLKYFKDNYAVRPQERAYCFRTRAGRQTTFSRYANRYLISPVRCYVIEFDL